MDHVDDSGRAPQDHYEARLRFVETLDQLGFYSYHVAEHHGTPLGFAPSPNVYLSAVAQRTRQLRFGPMVYVAGLYHPMRLAEEICMLDQLSGGRLQVGMGRGAVALEQDIYGVDPATTANGTRRRATSCSARSPRDRSTFRASSSRCAISRWCCGVCSSRGRRCGMDWAIRKGRCGPHAVAANVMSLRPAELARAGPAALPAGVAGAGARRAGSALHGSVPPCRGRRDRRGGAGRGPHGIPALARLARGAVGSRKARLSHCHADSVG